MRENSLVAERSLRGQIIQVCRLSVPAILTHMVTMAMQYIDSAMVGGLGANASAAIGLVSSSTWLMSGLGSAISAGFSVQVAQHIGAGEPDQARRVIKHGMLTSLICSLLLAAVGAAISGPLPRWLGGEEALWKDASAYFLVFMLTRPLADPSGLTAGFLQSAGNMIVPSVTNAAACVLDVVFNALLIPRYGVLGAALGTSLASIIVGLINLWYCCFRFEPLRLNRKERCPADPAILRRALKIGLPVGAETLALSGASVVSTTLIAPLGAVVLAGHSFALTAESLCYMPACGIAAAAATLVGQCVGRKDYPLARRYGNLTIAFGGGLMVIVSLGMYIGCPLIFRMLTPVPEVQAIAAQVLRIGLIAEPLFGLSLISSGVLRGAEDTLVPSVLNLLSVWVVRLGLAALLVPKYGIHGMWIAMAVELCIRGLLMLTRQLRSRYLRPELAKAA